MQLNEKEIEVLRQLLLRLDIAAMESILDIKISTEFIDNLIVKLEE